MKKSMKEEMQELIAAQIVGLKKEQEEKISFLEGKIVDLQN